MMTNSPSQANSDVLQPLRSVHSSNLSQLLSQNNISLVVSTYQAGKVILVRSDGPQLNTHFRQFNRPMGIAANQTRMTIGEAYQLVELYNVPIVARKLEPAGKHDACYIPRNTHITGDIDIHEMAWAADELWVVNTRFSCLCTLDNEHSFVPRWRPPFISGLGVEDRCHLNGLAVVDDRPAYVTALAETNTPQGWREHKSTGGILMDIDTQEVICRGLAMPHSPRWYAGKLWVLESGKGTLATIDMGSGQLQTVIELPGFTRGLDFYGPFAFVGLSQVRESAVFSGIPLTERLEERICGVWIIHIHTGEIIGFLRFEAAVQEIFAVTVLPQISFPEILERNSEKLASSYVLPDQALEQVELNP